MAHCRAIKVVEEEENICERASKPLCLHNPSKAAFRARFNLRGEMASRHLLAGLPNMCLFCNRLQLRTAKDVDGVPVPIAWYRAGTYYDPQFRTDVMDRFGLERHATWSILALSGLP